MKGVLLTLDVIFFKWMARVPLGGGTCFINVLKPRGTIVKIALIRGWRRVVGISTCRCTCALIEGFRAIKS